MAAVLLLVVTSSSFTTAQYQPLSDWQDGRSTYYTTWEQGACNYGKIAVDTFPFNNIAAPNEAFYNKSGACGGCFEIQCVGAWDPSYCSNACLKPNASVVIEVADECPVQGNEQWCSGDITHFDLSQHAFDQIADNKCGVIKQRWRQVSCDYGNGQNIMVKNHDGINEWYFGITIENVNHWGQLSKVEMQDASSGTFIVGDRQDYNVWLWQNPNGLKTPISVRITDSHGNVLMGKDVVTSFTGNAKFNLGTNCMYSHQSVELFYVVWLVQSSNMYRYECCDVVYTDFNVSYDRN